MTIRKAGIICFTLFIAYIAYTILTPHSLEVARLTSPDGNRTARLRKIYYVAQPSYKVASREHGKRIWNNLLYMASYTNAPHETAEETLAWTPDSERLDFLINGTSVWYHVFE